MYPKRALTVKLDVTVSAVEICIGVEYGTCITSCIRLL